MIKSAENIAKKPTTTIKEQLPWIVSEANILKFNLSSDHIQPVCIRNVFNLHIRVTICMYVLINIYLFA